MHGHTAAWLEGPESGVLRLFIGTPNTAGLKLLTVQAVQCGSSDGNYFIIFQEHRRLTHVYKTIFSVCFV
jgi:hypothetical protein